MTVPSSRRLALRHEATPLLFRLGSATAAVLHPVEWSRLSESNRWHPTMTVRNEPHAVAWHIGAAVTRPPASSHGCLTPAGSDSDRVPEAVRRHNRYLTPMEVPQTADARTLAAWDALADQVAVALRRAGLPVTGPATDVTNGRTGRKYGAFVEVDPIADGAGGVFVFWQVPDELARPSREALLAGRLNDPAIQRYGHVVAIMIDAMKRLLAESKFAVEDAATVNDLRPLEIHVRSVSPA